MPKFNRINLLRNTFTPSAPVARRDRFAGRAAEVVGVLSAFNQPGKHVILYGERGVGKTSLANVISEFLDPFLHTVAKSVRVNCTTQDKFRTIWTKVYRNIGLAIPEEWSFGSPDPDAIRHQMEALVPHRFIILDEFDRVEDDETLSLMADTIKALSDHDVRSRLVIVGVADSIDQLIGEHESVQRAIEEVQLRRMTSAEAASIINKGLEASEMTASAAAKVQISKLAEGLPHYVHLLAQAAAVHAVEDDRLHVEVSDVRAATEQAVEKHSVLKEYQNAVQSPKKGSLFGRLLASCALAEKNRLGQFTASAVREPMSRIMGRRYEIPAFAAHLKSFTEIDRGSVLRREGTERKYTYRFRNPLLQPFAVLAALAEGVIPEDYVAELLGAHSDDFDSQEELVLPDDFRIGH